MDKEKRTPCKVSTITAKLSLGEGDYGSIPSHCKHAIIKEAIHDSAVLLPKMESPVVFYVTMLAYLKARRGLSKLFDAPSDRHLAIHFSASMVESDVKTHEEKGKEIPESLMRASNGFTKLMDKIDNGDDSELTRFHDMATSRYEMAEMQLTEEDIDDFESVLDGNWTDTVAKA